MEQPQRLHCAHTPSHLLEPRDHPLTARLLHRALDVGRQAKEGGGVSLGQLRDQLNEGREVRGRVRGIDT